MSVVCVCVCVRVLHQVATLGIDASAYSVKDGYVSLPDVPGRHTRARTQTHTRACARTHTVCLCPGFGLVLDEAIFKAAVKSETGRSFGKPLYAK